MRNIFQIIDSSLKANIPQKDGPGVLFSLCLLRLFRTPVVHTILWLLLLLHNQWLLLHLRRLLLLLLLLLKLNNLGLLLLLLLLLRGGWSDCLRWSL